VACSTAGASPFFAAGLLKAMTTGLPTELSSFVELLAELRVELRSRVPDEPTRKLWMRHFSRMEHLARLETEGIAALRAAAFAELAARARPPEG